MLMGVDKLHSLKITPLYKGEILRTHTQNLSYI